MGLKLKVNHASEEKYFDQVPRKAKDFMDVPLSMKL